MRRGWFFGAQQLKEELLEQMGGEMGAHHGGEEKQETDEQKAEGLVQEELVARVDGGGIGETPQDGRRESEGGGAAACGDGDDAGLESAYSGQLLEAMKSLSTMTGTDTFFLPLNRYIGSTM